MGVERDERGWAVETSEFMNCASRQRRGSSVEVTLDKEDLEVRVDEGSGYLSQTTTAYVPLDILVRMLQHAGYKVERR